MTINEFKEEIEEFKCDKIRFCYEYHTRDYFCSYEDINNCSRKTYIVPRKGYEIIDNKLYIECYKSSNHTKLFNFTNRYPTDLETILIYKKLKFKLETSGSRGIEDCWDCRLEEYV